MGESFINESDYEKMEVVVIGVGEGCDYRDRSITGLFSVLFSSKMELGEKREYSVVRMESDDQEI